MNVDAASSGRLLLRWWFPAAYTPHCGVQAAQLRASWRQLADLGLDVVGLSFDPPGKLASWRAEQHLPFPLLTASLRQAAAQGALRDVGDPWRATLAARVASIVDDRGQVVASWHVEDVETFADQVRDALAQVAEGANGGGR